MPHRPIIRTTSAFWNRNANVAAGAALAALAVGLRIPLLGGSFWRDEGSTFAVSGETSISAVLQGVHRTELTPPLYYLFEHGWIALVGTSETAMRFPSLTFSALAALVLYDLARRIASPLAAMLVALFAALAPVFLSAGMEARAYGLTVLLCSLTLYCFGRVALAAEKNERRLFAVALAASAGALNATHFTGFVVSAVLLLASLVYGIVKRNQTGAALVAALGVALAISSPLVPLFAHDASHFRGIARHPQPFIRTLDDHLDALSPFGAMVPQADRFLEGGLILWLAGIALRRQFAKNDAWIALFCAIAAAGIAVSIARRLSLERHLLAYAPPLWLAMALLLDRYCSWLRARSNGWVSGWKIATALLLVYILAGSVVAYPRVYAQVAATSSGSRALVADVLARQRGRRTLLVALPDNVAPALWYYARNTPALTLRGVATWEQPQWYSFYDTRPWFTRDFDRLQADRIEAFADAAHARIALAISPHPAYYNGIPFYRAREVAAVLERRRRVLYRADFAGWREPLELVVLGQRSTALRRTLIVERPR